MKHAPAGRGGWRLAARLAIVNGLLVCSGDEVLVAEVGSAPAGTSSTSSPQAVAVEPGVPPRPEDRLSLTDGTSLDGTLLDEAVTLRTACGRIQLGQRWLARVTLDRDSGLARILTVNSNRLSGFLEDTRLTFETARGERVEIRVERIRELCLQGRPEADVARAPARWFQLRNGDLLSGELLTNALPMRCGGARRNVLFDDVANVAFGAQAGDSSTVTLRRGEGIEGVIELEDFPLRLEWGPTIQVPRDRLAFLSAERPGDASIAKAGATLLADSDPPPTTLPGLTNFVWIPPGEFVMGSPNDEIGRDQDEGPETPVVIAHGFWIAKCEVTQAEYKAVMGVNPSIFTGDPSRPVEKVSWLEAMEFCARLTETARVSGTLPPGFVYRLPTEAEWEYACRAGTRTPFSHGEDAIQARLGEYAWFGMNSDSATHPVGGKQPNPWGLHDMHGNVWEWCLDRMEYSGARLTNAPAAATGALRVARGGSWLYDARACRSANRDDYGPSNRCGDVGFRVVLARGPGP